MTWEPCCGKIASTYQAVHLLDGGLMCGDVLHLVNRMMSEPGSTQLPPLLQSDTVWCFRLQYYLVSLQA